MEVLIALSVTVVLIIGVYGAIDVHFKYQNAGRAEMRGAQLIRGILVTGHHDFTSALVHIPPVDAVASEDGAAAEDTSSTVVEVVDSGPVSAGTEAQTFGLVGTGDWMHMTVSVPTKTLSATGISDGLVVGRLSDLMIVSYGICPIEADNMRILQQDMQNVQRPPMGMARREVDLYDWGSATDDIGPEWLLAPEVTELQIQYFNGTSWADTWDSRVTGTLPTAVKFTLGVWNPPPLSRNPTSPTSGAGTVTYTETIFHLPASTPVEVADAQAQVEAAQVEAEAAAAP